MTDLVLTGASVSTKTVLRRPGGEAGSSLAIPSTELLKGASASGCLSRGSSFNERWVQWVALVTRLHSTPVRAPALHKQMVGGLGTWQSFQVNRFGDAGQKLKLTSAFQGPHVRAVCGITSPVGRTKARVGKVACPVTTVIAWELGSSSRSRDSFDLELRESHSPAATGNSIPGWENTPEAPKTLLTGHLGHCLTPPTRARA